ncbi:transcriptional regulator [Oceanobacillus piezotolerans]|uniref:HTH-type transcriptional regulator n=1 Tax=Oceanobacillus piezotolerans TaxID=2448030 RepID=A0A498D5L4_9BACI|nr:transcriptional regulator [Oceanobacillus piezotolerans]RLL45008.1 transcriptional regulator [Oceanobacillus piezotolerans]
MKEVEHTQQIMIQFSKTIEMFGLTPLEARLYTYLFLSDKALTLDEMGIAMGKSKTAMSTNIRSLLDLNLVTRVWRKGVRKDLYEANSQLLKSFMNFYFKKRADQIIQQKEALEHMKESIEENKTAIEADDFGKFTSQLESMIDFHQELENRYKNMG